MSGKHNPSADTDSGETVEVVPGVFSHEPDDC